MKLKGLVRASSLGIVALTVVGCGNQPLPERTAHKDEKIYSAKIDGQTRTGLTWAESYDAVIAKTKVTSGDERNEYLHQAEDILMSTGAITPIYYYTDIFMKNAKMTGYYGNPLGFKFFGGCLVDGKDEFTVCVGPKGDSYDPAINSAVDGAIVINQVFEGLYRWKAPASGNVAGELEPGQAASYVKESVGTDGHVKYTFTLKSGIKFSDGTDIKPSHFAQAWARAASGLLGADYGYMFDCIVGYDATAAKEDAVLPLSGVVADDSKGTLEVEIISDLPYFLELTAFPTYFPILADKATGDDWWTKPAQYVGNGPLKVTAMNNIEGGTIVFEKNDKYWDASSVKAKKVTFALTEDDGAQLTNFQTGAWSFIDSVPNDSIDNLKQTKQDEFFVNGQLGTYYMIWNVNDKTFNRYLTTEEQHAKMRKALSLFIDRNYICEKIGQAGQEPANTFVGKGIMESHDDKSQTEWTTKSGLNRDGQGYYKVGKGDLAANVAEGIQALKDLGFTYDEGSGKFKGMPTIKYLFNAGTGHQKIAEYLQSCFKQYGIKVKLESQEWAVFLNTRKEGNYSMARNGWLADYNDACSFLDMWTTGSGNNDAQFGR